jgi:chromosome segregation ATPase
VDWSTVFGIGGVVVGIISAIVSVHNARSSAKKVDVDAQSQIISDLHEAYEHLSEENESLRADLNNQRVEHAAQAKIISTLHSAYERLTKENESLRSDLNDLQIDYAALVSKHNALEEQYKHVCGWAYERGYRVEIDL